MTPLSISADRTRLPERRAVFLDRDGVPEACARLREGGFALIVVTNQPEVARGRLSRDAVEAIHDFGIDLARSFMVGDRWRDIEAGRRAGCRTIFIDYGYEEPRPEGFDFTTDSPLGAAEWICAAEAPAGA